MPHGLFDSIFRQRYQLHVDGPEHVRVKDELGFPVRGFGSAGEPLFRKPVQQFQRVVNIMSAAIVPAVDLLQQNDVGVFVAYQLGNLVQRPEDVLPRRPAGDGLVGCFDGRNPCRVIDIDVVEEHIVLAGHVLHVVAHDLERRACGPFGRVRGAGNAGRFDIGWRIRAGPKHGDRDYWHQDESKQQLDRGRHSRR